jgi:hypothetical protein
MRTQDHVYITTFKLPTEQLESANDRFSDKATQIRGLKKEKKTRGKKTHRKHSTRAAKG